MKPFSWTARLPLAEFKPTPETRVLAPASAVLQALLNDAPADQFTLVWLLGQLNRRSFGFIMLLLALVAVLPGIVRRRSATRRPDIGDDRGARRPCLPPWNCCPSSTNPASRPHCAPGHSGSEVSREGDPSALAHPVDVTKRVVGVVVLLLTVLLLLAPVPMIQVLPAMVIVLISLAYLRGGRSPALDRAPHCRCSLGSHGGCGLENGRRRRRDRPIMAIVREGPRGSPLCERCRRCQGGRRAVLKASVI